jgi:hypothetical protein
VANAAALSWADSAAGKAGCALVASALWLYFFSTLPPTYFVHLNDFPAYYGAATSIASGHPEQLYGNEFKWFTNLPVVALLMRPLAALDYAQAWKFFWWLQVISFVLTYGVLVAFVRQFYAPLSGLLLLASSAIFLCFSPLMLRCLDLGQTTPMMVLLFAGVIFAARSGWVRVSGAVLGIICVIKIPPNLLIILLALRRRLSLALPAAAVVVAAVMLSFALFGSELVSQFFERVVAENFGRSEAAFNNQSFEGALMRIFTDRGLADWTTTDRPLPVTIGVVSLAIALAALLYLRAPGFLVPSRLAPDADPREGSLELETAIGVAVMLLLFPVVWIHYYLFLAVPLTLLPFWWIARDLSRPAWLLALLALALWFASGTQSHENAHYAARETEWLFRMAQNRQPLGALLLVVGLSFPLAELAARARNK